MPIKTDGRLSLSYFCNAKKAIESIPDKGSSLSDYKKLMLERLLELNDMGLPKNWDGVFTAQSK